MLTARECIEVADRERAWNRHVYASTPRWRWLKRSRLNDQWMRNVEYRQMMERIAESEGADSK